VPVLQLQQAGQQRLAEPLGALARQQGRQVVDADHAQWQARVAQWQGDGHGRLVKGGGDVVDGDGVVGVRATVIDKISRWIVAVRRVR